MCSCTVHWTVHQMCPRCVLDYTPDVSDAPDVLQMCFLRYVLECTPDGARPAPDVHQMCPGVNFDCTLDVNHTLECTLKCTGMYTVTLNCTLYCTLDVHWVYRNVHYAYTMDYTLYGTWDCTLCCTLDVHWIHWMYTIHWTVYWCTLNVQWIHNGL